MSFTVSDLRTGDIIVSYKKPEWWNFVKKFFNWRVRKYSQRVLGKNCVFPHATHDRVIEDKIHGIVTGFHWTDPCSTPCEITDDLVDPSYALVYRKKKGPLNPERLYAFCLKHSGMLYDLGELVDMDLGIRLFGFGRNHYVCATGVRAAVEAADGPLDAAILAVSSEIIPFEKTPPCIWANLPDIYECINKPSQATRTSAELMSPELPRRKAH